jgi:NADH:ubiquinone oxidoreductase subunit 2 (subunit N)
MGNERKKLFKKAFVTSFLFTIIGAMMKIFHWQYASIFLIMGILSTILYVVVGIYEVNKSNRISSSEKTLWTIGFILFSFFVGLYYLISGRKKVA